MCLARPLIYISSSPVGRVPTKIERCLQRLSTFTDRFVNFGGFYYLFFFYISKGKHAMRKMVRECEGLKLEEDP